MTEDRGQRRIVWGTSHDKEDIALTNTNSGGRGKRAKEEEGESPNHHQHWREETKNGKTSFLWRRPMEGRLEGGQNQNRDWGGSLH